LLTSVLKVFFKDTKLRNYLLEKLNISISNELNAQIYMSKSVNMYEHVYLLIHSTIDG